MLNSIQTATPSYTNNDGFVIEHDVPMPDANDDDDWIDDEEANNLNGIQEEDMQVIHDLRALRLSRYVK